MLLTAVNTHALRSVDATKPEDIGAGDQGIMFGYASDEHETMMPLSHHLATAIGIRLTEVCVRVTVRARGPFFFLQKALACESCACALLLLRGCAHVGWAHHSKAAPDSAASAPRVPAPELAARCPGSPTRTHLATPRRGR